MYDSWTVGGPEGAKYNRSKSGWFDQVLFTDWLRKVAIPHFKSLPRDDRKVMIGDNLASHI